MKTFTGSLLAALALSSLPALATRPYGFGLAVLVDGVERPEFVANGNVYVEALKGQEYALRITNPLNVRVAVALAVDGLNTIDAKHTDAWSARKWVLAPYETIVISGWQVNQATARKFYFTGERSSYGAFLGKTQNLGVLEAVFYKEKETYRQTYVSPWRERRDGGKEEQRAGEKDQERLSSNERERAAALEGALDRAERGQASEPGSRSDAAAPAMPMQAEGNGSYRDHSKKSSVPAPAQPSDEYAATGIGSRTEHGVTAVAIDLESSPVATLRLRYEFRPQLIRLGVIVPRPDPLGRREAASGFGSFCPEPGL